MASTEIVLLRSSPPHQQRERDEEPTTTPPALQYVPNSSSSDGSSLPSVTKLWTKWDPKQKETGATRASPLPPGSRSRCRNRDTALPQKASVGSQTVKDMAGRKELSIEEELVDMQDENLTGGKTRVGKQIQDATKPKQSRVLAKTKSKVDTDIGVEKEAKTKAKRKSRARAITVDDEDTVSNHFGQSVGTENIEDMAAKPKAKRKSRAKPVVSTHFDRNNATAEISLETIEKTTEKTVAPATKKRKRKEVDAPQGNPKALKGAFSKSEAKASKTRNKTGKASTHFAGGDVSRDNKNETIPKSALSIPEPHESMELAEKRRKSWTPVPDTAAVQLTVNEHDIYEVPSSSQPPSPVESTSAFRSMVGSFGFDSRSVTRSASPEKANIVGPNKRRRIELIDDTTLVLTHSTTVAPALSELEVPATKEVKKMSPKKLAFSITNKVLDRYAQPADIAEKTSMFFAPRIEPPIKTVSPEKVATLVKTRKGPKARSKGSVKPRAAKKVAEEGTKAVKSKAKAKATKPKRVVDMGQKLISPSSIASRAEHQIVMFGTSSQLLTGDSPNTLRQLQEALKESEMMASIEEEPTCTAPVQRRLARGIRHTSGKLWAQQADSLVENSADSEDPSSPTIPREPDILAIIEEEVERPELPQGELTETDLLPLQYTEDGFQTLSDEIDAMDFDDLESPSNRRATAGGFMPTQTNFEEERACRSHEMSSTQALLKESTHILPRQPDPEERNFFEWHSLSSPPKALPEEKPRTESRQRAEEKASVWHSLSSASALSEGHDILGVRKSPSPVERTIKPIPKRAANAPTMRSSLFSSLTPSVSRTALRPLSTNMKSPKKSSGSQKANSEAAAATLPTATGSVQKKRGRPPKAQVKEQKATLPLHPTPKNCRKKKERADDWHDINDEILDSEPDMTPSPRRRDKRAPPSPLPDLVLNATEAATKRVNGVLANANHPQWPKIQAKLFPDITLAVKGQPRSIGGQKLTWYEKMLMYDPIVIEDLTVFVNAEGLRITVKEKEEEIRGWMVQKWCEENSVCCLWKEGLRGGVKTKY
ncbi:hypothetical protein FKW77_010360 [Venturia effusa]|uniref:Structure-specific endonuclease subunit SLX4 n=1 Tax=Venturia effusa TaxID=50376 RepID=A0A517L4K5_9PEZI|nr:hypothetical protein FKW77_010360 [Venturia effusa]